MCYPLGIRLFKAALAVIAEKVLNLASKLNVSSHAKRSGNEVADRLAKKGIWSENLVTDMDH